MKLGILETGRPPEEIAARFGTYVQMFQTLLGAGYDWHAYDVRSGVLPNDVADADAYLVTGSATGVYDDVPWIAPLKAFLQQASGRTPLVGICFGHQLMAEAFGGKVIKSPKGWGIGLHRYDVVERASWMEDGARAFAIPVSHQDQVVEIPADARRLAASTFTEYAALAYPDRNAISFQGHPEFAPDYAAALIETRRGVRFDEGLADEALASLQKPNDSQRVADWIGNFLAQRRG
jgi:GMP synthase-like glutamine amidotransferase